MGIITVLLFKTGHLGDTFYVPLWVVLACHLAMALGTLSGGWRIVRTMGSKVTKQKPVGGVCAETGGAITLFAATVLGIPVSTTHTITGAIVGVGAVTMLSAIRWGVAGRNRVGVDSHDPVLAGRRSRQPRSFRSAALTLRRPRVPFAPRCDDLPAIFGSASPCRGTWR